MPDPYRNNSQKLRTRGSGDTINGIWLCVCAYAHLILFDVLTLFGLRAIRLRVVSVGVNPARRPESDAKQVVDAVLDACVLYIKPVLCLQRAFVTARMLRRRGIPAELVIGYQSAPIRSHAWVTVHKQTVIGAMHQQPFFKTIDVW